MMKIMTAMYTMRRGGAYDRFIMMLEAFLERGCDVHCLSLSPIRIENPLFYNHRAYFPLKSNESLVAKFVVLFLFPLYSLLIGWREKIDIFIAFGPFYAFLQGMPKWLLRKSMVTFVRLDLSLGLKIKDSSIPLTFVFKVIEYIGLIFSDRVIAVNKTIKEVINKVIGKRQQIEVKVLFNNITSIRESSQEEILQTKFHFGISGEAKILATAGILTDRKHFEILLKCLPQIGISDLFLFIIGGASKKEDYNYRNYLEDLKQKLKIDRRVIFTGWVEKRELLNIYLASDLFVLSSLKEGMPNAILEALGCNIPCLGSNIPGIRDILYYDELMFDPWNEQAISKKISNFFLDVHYSNYIARLCQKRKKTFIFDWKEKVFQMVTMGISDRGGA